MDHDALLLPFLQILAAWVFLFILTFIIFFALNGRIDQSLYSQLVAGSLIGTLLATVGWVMFMANLFDRTQSPWLMLRWWMLLLVPVVIFLNLYIFGPARGSVDKPHVNIRVNGTDAVTSERVSDPDHEQK